jgi:hypothetical protein
VKVILRPRRTGRTEDLVELCIEAEAYGEPSYIVCSDHREAVRISRVAEEKGYHISFPITFHEFLTHQYAHRNIKNFFIDNADILLQQLSPVQIRAVTMMEQSE